MDPEAHLNWLVERDDHLLVSEVFKTGVSAEEIVRRVGGRCRDSWNLPFYCASARAYQLALETAEEIPDPVSRLRGLAWVAFFQLHNESAEEPCKRVAKLLSELLESKPELVRHDGTFATLSVVESGFAELVMPRFREWLSPMLADQLAGKLAAAGQAVYYKALLAHCLRFPEMVPGVLGHLSRLWRDHIPGVLAALTDKRRSRVNSVVGRGKARRIPADLCQDGKPNEE
jgi:hypothetical protein